MSDRRQVFKVGTRIGKELIVLGVLDKGGKETVYIVWHHGAWCYMACKVFRSSRRAKREANVLSTMAHPNIVRFFGLSKPANLLTELLDGPVLSRMIRQQPKRCLGVSDAVRVAIHLGAALEYIHSKGVLHLDVKPYNVIVASGGRPILYDFGCARIKGAPRPSDIAGTDPYIAPEECLRESVTPAADVFGLGVTLYEMLTGELPFREGKGRNRFPQTTEPPNPVRRHRAGVPASLDDLVLSCLARDPESRPRIAALLPALHGFIRQGPPMWPAGFQPERAR
jgi:serine/threonine protein kinase